LNSDTKCPAEDEKIRYMTRTIPGTFPDINLLPTTADEVKNIINYLTLRRVWCYDVISTNYPKLAQTILLFL
jgi:hypothetical protein